MSIKQIIEEEIGLKNQEEFRDYYKSKLDELVSDEDIERLNPDKIDNSEFWSYLDNNFDRAICGGTNKDKNGNWEAAENSLKAKETNTILNVQCGVLNYLESLKLFAKDKNLPISVLEIGTGLGSAKVLIDEQSYTGIDVVPRVNGVIKTDGNGLPEEVKKNKYNYVFSCNVFQHLSKTQRLNYYSDIYDVLPNEGCGYFALATQTSNSRVHQFCRDKQGKQYICHYGQFTPIDSFQEICTDVIWNGRFSLLHSSVRFDGFTTFVFLKNPPK